MSRTETFLIAVFPGDGIGNEITDPCLHVLERACAPHGIGLRFTSLAAGAGHYQRTGTALPEASLDSARHADAILLAAMGLPDVRYPDGTEISPQLDLRSAFGLYAGVRPVRLIPGVPSPLADPRAAALDLVLVRESTEGLFASRGKGTVDDDAVARDMLTITRSGSERLFDFAFRLARRRRIEGRPGRLTCVDKANVFASFAFFRKIFDERAAAFPEVQADHMYVDAVALNLVREPWRFDVLVTENMFGDILSDLCAGLVGGMGMAPSADIGDEISVFQPCHGSAPDIAGTGKANPTAMFLSAAMMLDWLGARSGREGCRRAAESIDRAVDQAFAQHGLRPVELGGPDGTRAITRAVLDALDHADLPMAATS